MTEETNEDATRNRGFHGVNLKLATFSDSV
jgi:hypothetical protein